MSLNVYFQAHGHVHNYNLSAEFYSNKILQIFICQLEYFQLLANHPFPIHAPPRDFHPIHPSVHLQPSVRPPSKTALFLCRKMILTNLGFGIYKHSTFILFMYCMLLIKITIIRIIILISTIIIIIGTHIWKLSSLNSFG